MRRLDGLSPRRRALLVVPAVVAVLLGALAMWAVVDGSGDDPGRMLPAQDQPGPVVLIPGYGGGTGGLEHLAEQIRATGRTATVVPLPDNGTGDLREQAEVVDGYVDDALDAGAPSVDVVAHSAGGVVARVWVAEHDGVHKARRIVTLGSPHHGAAIAAAGAAILPGACPTACQQLAPGSALLADLATPVPNPPVWLSLWTAGDEVVRPPESAILDGAHSLSVQSVCPGVEVGHSDLLTDPVATAFVLAAIGPVEYAVPIACPSS